MRQAPFCILAALSLATVVESEAVILLESEIRNTTAPTAAYANSGWQYAFPQGDFLGTPVGPNLFVSAAHIGPGVGNQVTWNNATYQVTRTFGIPDTDIIYAEVAETFPFWAPVYDESVDGAFAGKEIAIVGRGTQRGAEVHLTTPPRPGESTLRGWENGPFDSVQSWGTNVIEGYAQEENEDPKEYLYFDFSRISGTPEESMVSSGDSGGPAFARGTDGIWKIVGVGTTVDGPFRTTATGPDIRGVMLDYGDLYIYDREKDVANFFPDTEADRPSNGYYSNITNYLSVVNPYIPVPGDANLDGKVNTVDFNLLAGHFGEATPLWASGDFNHDGVVSSTDFTLLLSRYGHVGTPPLGAATTSVGVQVPEQASAAGVIAMILPLLRRPRQDQL